MSIMPGIRKENPKGVMPEYITSIEKI